MTSSALQVCSRISKRKSPKARASRPRESRKASSPFACAAPRACSGRGRGGGGPRRSASRADSGCTPGCTSSGSRLDLGWISGAARRRERLGAGAARALVRERGHRREEGAQLRAVGARRHVRALVEAARGRLAPLAAGDVAHRHGDEHLALQRRRWRARLLLRLEGVERAEQQQRLAGAVAHAQEDVVHRLRVGGGGGGGGGRRLRAAARLAVGRRLVCDPRGAVGAAAALGRARAGEVLLGEGAALGGRGGARRGARARAADGGRDHPGARGVRLERDTWSGGRGGEKG